MNDLTGSGTSTTSESPKQGGQPPRRNKKKNRKSNFSKKQKEMIAACESMLTDTVVEISFPGGKSRDAVALHLESGGQVIAAVRGNSYRAGLEHRVLESLSSRGVPVPAVLGFDSDTLLIQEKIEGERLSAELTRAGPEGVEHLLGSALDGLARSQQAGSQAGLDDSLPALGVGKEWINDLLRRPLVIGGYLDVRPGRPRVDALRKLFAVKRTRFIKWDARPGNAMVNAERQVYWFDWEHSGTRCRLDDAAWLLCDEFTPNLSDVESRLIARYLDEFADGLSLDEAERYLRAYGVFHSVVRLGLILSLKKDEAWWDFDYCVERDKVGVTLDCAQRVALRAARWADFDPATRPLVVWFENIADRLEAM